MEEKEFHTFDHAKEMLGATFITVTLKPEHYTRKVKIQYSLLSKATAKLLKQYCDKVMMIPELTQKCNIHIHAVIKWTTRIDYPEIRILDDIKDNKYIGIIYITPQKIHSLESANRVWEYMTEDAYKTRKILGLPNIVSKWEYEIISYIKEKKILDYIDGLCVCEEHTTQEGVIREEKDTHPEPIRKESQTDRL